MSKNNRSKPGTCPCLSFAKNPVLSKFYKEIQFFIQFDILVPNYSERDYFSKMEQI